MSEKKEKSYKNLIFYFTSRLLFMIIAIIFICYGSSLFVHADEDYNIHVNYFYDYDFTSLGEITNNVFPFIQSDIKDSFSLMYGSNVYNPMNDLNGYGFYFANNNTDFSLLSSDFPIMTKFKYDYDRFDIDYSSGDYYIFMFAPNNNGSTLTFSYYIVPKSVIYNNVYLNIGINNYVRVDVVVRSDGYIEFNPNAAYEVSPQVVRAFFSDMPMWVTNGAVISSNDIEPNVTDSFDSNYIANINIPLVSGGLDPVVPDPEPEKEGAVNNLYFESVQVGISSLNSNSDIIGNNYIVGVDVSDFVKNNIDDFYVKILITIRLKDSDLSINDPITSFNIELPCKYFLNQVYTVPISEVFANAPVSGNYFNFLDYYRHIQSTHSVRTTSTLLGDRSGIFPTILNTLDYAIGFYDVSYSTVNDYQIFDFDSDVYVFLGARSLNNRTSAPYTKHFDFLNGSENITNGSGLVNYDPWEGEEDSQNQLDPYVPSYPSGGNNNNISGGNTSVVVNNNGGKVPLNAHSQTELNNIIVRYGNLTKTFNDYFMGLANQTQDNNFLSVIEETLPMIPGINFMVACACMALGLAVILLVLKVLLF